MNPKTQSGLTLQDIATLADGTGNITDATASRLAAYIRSDPRFNEALSHFRQMAEDAGVEYLADGLEIHQIITELRQSPSKAPCDVIHPALDVPYTQLINMATALAIRASGKENTELIALTTRLIVALSDELDTDHHFTCLLDRFLSLEEQAAQETLAQLVEHYRQLRGLGVGRVQTGSMGDRTDRAHG